MGRLFSLKPGWALGIYVVVDIICVGMGMGVPIFCILLGFLVGWVIARMVTARDEAMREILGRILRYAVVSSAFTGGLMVVIWGRCIPMLFDPASDLANFGIPLILYAPKASFIGWLVLMMVISPFLQLLTTLFASYVTLLKWLPKGVRGG
jgi:hypothetical protein